MVTVPVRGLAAKGILHDPSPYQLDMDAWSAGANVRFHANKAERAPIFRSVYDTLPEAPAFAAALDNTSGGYDTVMIPMTDGRTFEYGAGTIVEVTPGQIVASNITIVGGTGYTSDPTVTFSAPSLPSGTTATGVAHRTGTAVTSITITIAGGGYATVPTVAITGGGGSGATMVVTALAFTPGTDPRAYTSTYLGQVLYMNRPNQAPQYFGPSSTAFAAMPNMETTWKARSLRTFGDYLIALNVTYPSSYTDPHTGLTVLGGVKTDMFKWSDLALEGAPPGSWDPFDPTTSAGENPLEDLTAPIVDGLPLRGNFVVYSENQIWGVTQTGTQSIFSFQRLFWEGGMIAPNCAVEVDGVHYVFGPQDIYKHDGVSKVSIIDKRNKNFVFRNLNKSLAEAFFVNYIPQLDSVLFAFNSGDTSCFFQGADRCNLGALYDIPNDTWTFLDLPNVSAFAQTNLNTILTWATAPSTTTWANVGGSWYDQQNTFVKNPVAVSGALTGFVTNNRLLGYDFMNKGNQAFQYVSECNAPAYLERTGIAMDQLGSDLTTYKKVRRIFPLVEIFDNVPVTILVGGSETPSGAPTYAPAVTFNPITDYKVDVIKGGRYLALRFTVSSPADFAVAGFDIDVTNNGRR